MIRGFMAIPAESTVLTNVIPWIPIIGCLWQTSTSTGFPDQTAEQFAAKPEPNPDLFLEFAQTGNQWWWTCWAPAVQVMQCCTGIADNLAIVDPEDPQRNESDYANFMLKDASGRYFETDDANGLYFAAMEHENRNT